MLEAEWRPESLMIAEKLKAHAEARGTRWWHWAMAWVLNNRAITSVIAGPRTFEQWTSYFGALDYTWTPEDENAGQQPGARRPRLHARLQRSRSIRSRGGLRRWARCRHRSARQDPLACITARRSAAARTAFTGSVASDTRLCKETLAREACTLDVSSAAAPDSCTRAVSSDVQIGAESTETRTSPGTGRKASARRVWPHKGACRSVHRPAGSSTDVRSPPPGPASATSMVCHRPARLSGPAALVRAEGSSTWSTAVPQRGAGGNDQHLADTGKLE